jgi:hypothetical protein
LRIYAREKPRLNRIGRDVVDALPLLYGGAERLADTSPEAPAVVPTVGYLDLVPSQPVERSGATQRKYRATTRRAMATA